MKYPFSREPDSPVDEQVLLNSEALAPGVALGPVWGPPRLCAGLLLRVALQVGKLHQLILLHRTVQPGLLPHSWSVNNQVVLKDSRYSETSEKQALGEVRQQST